MIWPGHCSQRVHRFSHARGVLLRAQPILPNRDRAGTPYRLRETPSPRLLLSRCLSNNPPIERAATHVADTTPRPTTLTWFSLSLPYYWDQICVNGTIAIRRTGQLSIREEAGYILRRFNPLSPCPKQSSPSISTGTIIWRTTTKPDSSAPMARYLSQGPFHDPTHQRRQHPRTATRRRFTSPFLRARGFPVARAVAP